MKVWPQPTVEKKEAATLSSSAVNLALKQEFFNTKDGKRIARQEDSKCSGVTCVCWAGLNDNQDQFAYVDEMGTLSQ